MTKRYRKTCLNAYPFRRERSLNYVFPGNAWNPANNVPPLIWTEPWTEYAAGNWELNIAGSSAGWIGETSGGTGSPNALIDPTNGVVNFQSDQVGDGTYNGAYVISAPGGAVDTNKYHRATLQVAFYNYASPYASQDLSLLIDSSNGNYVGGYEVQARCLNGTTQFQLVLIGLGSQKGVVNIAPALGKFYDMSIEVDGAGNVNAYFDGQLLISTPFIATGHGSVGINCNTVTPNAAGVYSTGAAIGTLKYYGVRI